MANQPIPWFLYLERVEIAAKRLAQAYHEAHADLSDFSMRAVHGWIQLLPDYNIYSDTYDEVSKVYSERFARKMRVAVSDVFWLTMEDQIKLLILRRGNNG